MYNLNRKLEELEVQGKSIKIAIIGAGHMGTGMVSQVVNMKGMIPSIVADINVDLAKASFTKAGIAEDQIVIVEDEKAAEAAIQEGKYVACKSFMVACKTPSIQAVVDATGSIPIGAEIALNSILNKKHISGRGVDDPSSCSGKGNFSRSERVLGTASARIPELTFSPDSRL